MGKPISNIHLEITSCARWVSAVDDRRSITRTLERSAAGETIDEIVAGYRGRVSKEAIVEVCDQESADGKSDSCCSGSGQLHVLYAVLR